MLLQPLRWLVYLASRFIWTRRYTARVVGREEVLRKPGPYLLLPNHPAYADPPNIIVALWPAFQFRPMLLETNFNNPVMAPFGWLLRAIKVPDLDKATAEGRQRAEQAVAEAVAALKAGDNVILWPSGRIQRDGVERIGGTRAASDILAAVPEATVVLVRTRGLWGSMYSWAPTAQKLHMLRLIARGAGILLTNLVFFAPKRRTTVTLEAFTAAERPEPQRDLVNRWMEGWFNADVKPEPPTFVPHHFLFGKRTHEFPPPPSIAEIDPSKIKPETKEGVAEILADRLKRPLTPDENRPDKTFMDLGIDSLDAMEVTLEVERRFGFAGDAMPTTVGQLWALAEGQAEREPPKPPPKAWFTPPSGSKAIEVWGDTIPEAIARRVLLTPKDVASMDDVGGLLRYEDILMRALMLADRFRQIPEPAVGLLLPASSAGVVCLVAMHFAGKLPVILNWTTGPGNMAHGVKLTGVRRVVTSKLFVDRAHVEVPGAEFLFLEDVRGTVGKLEMLWRMLAMKWFPRWVAERALAKLDKDPQKPCVVLFTSGSEKAPKAVPLTHENILSDLKGAAPRLKVSRDYSVLVFLPLFHSFGHTVTGLFTLIVGVKVVYHPDPTDAGALVRKVATYKPNCLAATPTFWGYMLDKAKPGDLDPLKLVVLGAERCPDVMFERTKQLAPNATIAEGYGITECAPVVAVNPPDATQPGTVGLPMVGIDVCVTDLETHEILAPGKRGMLHVSGPIVFPGYLGYEGESPFKEFADRTWYVTGDLAEIQPDGYVRLHGRLRRFIKAGGEMISLPALEEPFARLYPPTDHGPRVAVEGIDDHGTRKIVLFTTEDVSLKDANALLTKEGFRGIMRLDEVRKVEKIPVLGTGKTDYKVLRAMIGG